jgi:hypothetical protein
VGRAFAIMVHFDALAQLQHGVAESAVGIFCDHRCFGIFDFVFIHND